MIGLVRNPYAITEIGNGDLFALGRHKGLPRRMQMADVVEFGILRDSH
jgi:hypothetical protein